MSKFNTNKKNKSQNLNMFLQKRKRVCLNIEEKLWILNYKQENRQITNAKVALDFSAKFKRPITKSCVQKILGNAEKIQSILKAAPDLEVKKAKHLKLTTKYEFEKDLDDRVIELVPIPDPDCEIIAEKPKEKRQIQQTMTKFLTAKQKK